jgi:hypothetical protein
MDNASDPSEADIIFDWEAVREACRSFLDSIVIELCFPGASYPKHTLYQILHDSIEESPKDAKRFPQTLWNAVGDLSVNSFSSSRIVVELTRSFRKPWIFLNF